MKRIIFILVLVGAIPLSLLAQDDDMYYVPGKSQQSEKADKPDESEQRLTTVAATVMSMSITVVDV